MLLGYVQDILLDAVLGHPDLDMKTKTVVLRAVNKVRSSSIPDPCETDLLTGR